MIQNTQVIFKQRPEGEFKPAESFEVVQLPLEDRKTREGEVLVKVLYLSLDPAMRGWMNDARSYIAPLEIGQVMRAYGLGQVFESNSAKFKKGELVSGIHFLF